MEWVTFELLAVCYFNENIWLWKNVDVYTLWKGGESENVCFVHYENRKFWTAPNANSHHHPPSLSCWHAYTLRVSPLSKINIITYFNLAFKHKFKVFFFSLFYDHRNPKYKNLLASSSVYWQSFCLLWYHSQSQP